MSKSTGITTFEIEVYLATDPETPVKVVARNPDLVRWDITRAKHGWGDMEASPMLWATFIAWAAMRRTGQYEGKWEEFWEKDALSVAAEEDTEEESDPTQQGHERDSA